MLKLHPVDLLEKLGVVSEDKTRAFPEKVYFSKEDYRVLENNLKKYAAKHCYGMSPKLINYSVGIDMLKYGPNQSLQEVIRPGWALIAD